MKSNPFLQLAILLSCTATISNAVVTDNPEPTAKYRADRVIVKPWKGVAKANVAAAHAGVGAQIHREYQRFGGMQVLQLPPGLEVKKFIERLRETGMFEYVQPDYQVHLEAMPNDPKLQDYTLWAMINTGQVVSGLAGVPDADIDATEAWDVRTDASTIIVG